MTDDTARLDRLEREVTELRRELSRLAKETAWVRNAESMTPLTAAPNTAPLGEPLDYLPADYERALIQR